MRSGNERSGEKASESREGVIAQLNLSYIYNARFPEETLTPSDVISLLPQSSTSGARGYSAPNRRQPDYMQDLHSRAEPPIEDAELERWLFYSYNYLKWRAASLRDDLITNPQQPDAVQIEANIRQCAKAAVKVEDYLFRANIALLAKMAKGSPERYSDAALGLLKAIRVFNIERGTRFSTIAVPCMQQAIWRAWRIAQRSREVAFTDLPDELVVSELSQKHGNDLEELDRHELLGIVLEALMMEAHLSRRERDMLELHYGINLLYDETLQEIAAKYEISRSRVGQIIEEAIKRMREAAEHRLISGKDF